MIVVILKCAVTFVLSIWLYSCAQFERYCGDDKRISEKDFGIILLTYAGLPGKKMARMLKRVKKKFKEEPQVVYLLFSICKVAWKTKCLCMEWC